MTHPTTGTAGTGSTRGTAAGTGDRRPRWRRFLTETGGSAITLVAIAMPVMVGFAGLGAETGLWYLLRRQAQTAADAGALSGAMEPLQDAAAVRAAALREAAANGFRDSDATDVLVDTVALPDGRQGVSVTVVRRQPPLFTALFREEPIPVAARAIAAPAPRGDACILALDRQGSAAVDFSGNTAVTLDGCVIAANSGAAAAIDVAGSVRVEAEAVRAVGGVNRRGAAELILAQGAAGIVTGAWPLSDPYAGRDFLPPGSCDHTKSLSLKKSVTLNPGVYCADITMQAQADVVLKPGTYWLKNADLKIQGQARVRCDCPNATDGVTILMVGSNPGTVDIRGGADVTLRAPSAPEAQWRGILIAQSNLGCAHNTNKFNGGSAMRLSGALYFPDQDVEYAGNTGAAVAGCTRIIAFRVRFTGSSEMGQSDCARYGAPVVPTRMARLVE